MSTKFEGFSQEEISKINSKPKKGGLFAAKSLGVGRGIRRVPDKPITSISSQNNQKNNKNNENGVKVKSSSSSAQILDNSLDYDKKISDESLLKLQKAVHFRPLSMKKEDQLNEKNEEKFKMTSETEIADESIIHLDDNEKKNFKNISNYTCPNEKMGSLDNKGQQSQMSPFRGVSLKDFEANRKIREEQNKLKKDMLYKAIEKHTQKTTAEVKKIEEIKSELSKLDQDLAADVAILRKQIETACIHYSNIEKHYNKVEQMFLKAKLDLHQASEKKELLTEHLCTVITYNEDRKAKKLTELMEKVGISPTTGEVENVPTENICSKIDAEIIEK